MNMTLRQLRAFAAVADTGSFTAAAGRLHLSQSALSVLVRELERELGTRLFDRHTRRVLLTEAGHELLPGVRACSPNWNGPPPACTRCATSAAAGCAWPCRS